jgi:hypothetical protein
MAHIYKALEMSASSCSQAQLGAILIDKYGEAVPVRERLEDGTLKGRKALLEFLREWEKTHGSPCGSPSPSPSQ